MKFGIVTFPGSNCDYDAMRGIVDVLGEEAEYLWHKERDLRGSDVVILPGGFSYGDYLRPGAIARFSPIMTEVLAHANKGAPVLCICNGFQIACEAGLLPGALLRNQSLQFVSAPVTMRVENNNTLFTSEYDAGQQITMPVGHGDGRYTADAATLDELEGEGRVVLRYVSAEANPNGAARDIAGIINDRGNVFGMMPHPERAMDDLVGSHDGIGIFRSVLNAVPV